MSAVIESSVLKALSSKGVDDVMSTDVMTVYEGWSIKRLAGFFVKHNISGAPVVASDEELVGVITQSDVVRFESREPTEQEIERLVQFYCGPYGGSLSKDDIRHLQEKANETCTVNSIMTPEVLSINVRSTAAEACQSIVKHDLHRIFVTREGKLVGVVSAMDFLRFMVG